MSKLQRFKSEALNHWQQYLPQKVKALKESGDLDEALTLAAQETLHEIEATKQGFGEAEAEHIAKQQFLLLPPE